MPAFVIYRRVSTARQGESGLGLEAQDRDIALFLDNYAEEGSDVIGTFTDVMSGAKADRPELAKALDLARETGATLLVAKLDRLSRNVAFLAALLDDKKVSLKVAAMPHADKFQLHIYAALAEQEREFISRRTKAALAEAKAKGRKLGGIRPGTAQRNKAVKVQADARAQKIAAIVQPMRTSGATLAAIGGALAAAGVQTPRGGKWSPAAVHNALKRLDQMDAA